MIRALWISTVVVASTSCVRTTQDALPASEVQNSIDETTTEETPNEVVEYVDKVSEERARVHAEAIPDSVSTGNPVDSYRQRATADQEPANEISETIAHIPVEINADVKRWIEYFTVKDRERFARFLERGERYRPMIQEVLKDQGLPQDIYYLAMIESGFSTHATSSARAVGVWQFMPGTGRRYGLRVDPYVDERRDPMRATVAASLYLHDLHNVFQSWYLAMAAYNAGEARIMNAIMNGKSRNFWELVKARRLPAETMNYIPKFLAAVIIGRNPDHYGFDGIKGSDPMPDLAMVKVASPVKLTDIARLTGISVRDLTTYNPQLRRGMTPPSTKTYGIWVPRGTEKVVAENQSAISKSVIRVSAPKTKTASTSNGQHRVKKGETLGLISLRYNVPIRSIKTANNLRSDRVYAGMRLKIPGAAAAAPASSSASYQRYRVKNGDNLDKIAKQFNVPIRAIKETNGLKRNTIYAGQVLKIATNDAG